MKTIQKIIENICLEEGIKYTLVSKGWITILEKDGVTRFLAGYKSGLNDHAVGMVCDDKYALYDVLKHFGINIAEHYILFSNYDKDEVGEYAKKYNYRLVVKINEGTCGNDMYQVFSEDELFLRIDELLKKAYSISILPFYDIKNEYRSIIFNNNVEVFYGKRRPIVIGDGEKTVYELLLDFNPRFFSKIDKNSNLDMILDRGEVFEYGWQHNLSKGAIPFYVDDKELEGKVKTMALQVAGILNLSFASVDIIELESGELMVLEANSGVMMENYTKLMADGVEVTENLYRKVIKELFAVK